MAPAPISNEAKVHLARIENVTRAFRELTARINIMIRLEGMMYGPLEYIVSASILEAVDDHVDCLKELKQSKEAIAETMNDDEQEEWKELMERVLEVEQEIIAVEITLRAKIQAYEERNSLYSTV